MTSNLLDTARVLKEFLFPRNIHVETELSRIPLQCVRTIAPERGWGGHFHTFTVFWSTLTSTWRYCLLECGKDVYTTEHFTTTNCFIHSEKIMPHTHVQSSVVYRVVNNVM